MLNEGMHFEIYFETFLVDNTNQICYLEQKYILSNDFSKRRQILLDSKNVLNSAQTLKGMGYAITFVLL